MADYIDAFPGRKISLNNRPYLYFGGTSYLGLQTDTTFQNILIRNIQKYGTNYGASRQSNIRFSIYEKAESYLAKLVQSEACLTLSSGYLAGQFICHHFNTKEYAFFYAPNAHSALYQSKIRPYTTFTALNIAVREHLTSSKRSIPVVLLDSIDFSGCNYPNFEGLRSLPLEDIVLVVDDSHGIGVVGTDGGGVYPVLSGLNAKELMVCCSLGKGFGIQAGAVFGSGKRISKLRDTAFFGGASPPSPASMASLVEGHSLYPKKRKLLEAHIHLFLETLENSAQFNHMTQHPAFSYSNKKLTRHLEENYIVATSFNYPEQDASTMHRLVLSAAHTKKDVEYLVKVVNSYHSL
ncbi:pyridoxal phosphate-dependent aminotransferase family protein [Flavobacteriaceae bacterium 3-367]|uniref:pyridoxal phosphate-dependent aminotransferase family protein n=1 Tax=Eudoraea algarum TaxID=3417568 RepID=UPI0032944C24